MNSNIKNNDFTEIELINGIVFIRYKDMSIIRIEEAKLIAKDVIDICNNIPRGFILDGLGISIQMNNEARNYFSSNPEYVEMGKASAIVINKMSSNLLAKFYIKYHKPIIPTKIFSNVEDAEDWIRFSAFLK